MNKLSRKCGLCVLLAFCLVHQITFAKKSQNKGDQLNVSFDLEKVKRSTDVPVLFDVAIYRPDWADEETPPYAILDEVNRWYYSISLEFGTDCHGIPACSLGSLSGRVLDVVDKDSVLKGKKVKLENGIVGVYKDFVCTVYCSDSFLTWRMKDHFGAPVQYTISLKAGEIEEVKTIANILISSGK